MEGAWNPDRFQDEYHDEVLALVDRKVRSGQTHEVLEPEAAPKRARASSDVVDLMPLLKKSLEARASGDKASRGSVGRRPATRKPARSKAPARKKRTA
jgi:DNA end-binding protein Ku